MPPEQPTETEPTVKPDSWYQNRIMHLVCLRRSLKEIAQVLCHSDTESEANHTIDGLIEELQHLKARRVTSLPWRQATEKVVGLEAYGLERIGLWPVKSD